MKTYAIVINNAVSNIIVADDESIALEVSPKEAIAVECQPSDGIRLGQIYDPIKDEFVVPEAPAPIDSTPAS